MILLGEPPEHIKRWIKDDFDRKGPLFFQANEAGASVAMRRWDLINREEQANLKCHLQYSIDKMSTWATYDGSTVYLDGCTDNRVYFRADPENPNTYGFHKRDDEHEEEWTHYFKTDGSVKAGGNIQFLLESTGTRTDVPESGYFYLFGGMLAECSSLTTAPELPATTLAPDCYWEMFRSCTSLTTAPDLPATTLVSNCYREMFDGCVKLASIDVSFTEWNKTEDATLSWMGVAGREATGEKTFTCPKELGDDATIRRGGSGCPNYWTVVNK